jgi:hypothetical protein
VMVLRFQPDTNPRRFVRFWLEVRLQTSPEAQALYSIHPEISAFLDDPQHPVMFDEDYGQEFYNRCVRVLGWPDGDSDFMPFEFITPTDEQWLAAGGSAGLGVRV